MVATVVRQLHSHNFLAGVGVSEYIIPGPYKGDQVSILLILRYCQSDQSLLPACFCLWHIFVSSPC